MTPPPPVPRGRVTGDRGTRQRAPVSDHPGDVLGTGLVLPHEEVVMFVGIDWATETHAVCVEDASRPGGRPLHHRAQRRGLRAAGRAGWPGTVSPALLAGGHRATGWPARWTGCSRPATRSCRSRPRPSRPGARPRSARAPRATPGTPGSSPTTCGCGGTTCGELRPFSAETRALRAVVRTRSDLVDARVAAANQLSATLAAFWPGAGEVFADVWSEIGLAFLERYPTRHRGRPPGRGAHGGLPAQARLQRTPHPGRAARAAAGRPGGPR